MKNNRFSPYKILKHNLKKTKYPIHIQVDLCGACNHNCFFCFFRNDANNIEYKRDDIRKVTFLDSDVALKAISEFAGLGVKAITFVGGGEPLIHKEIEEIVENTVENGMEYGVITNLDIKKSPHFLKKASWIRVSVDAGKVETYNLIHNPPMGSFERVKKNIEYLSGFVEIGVSFLVCKENYKDIFLACELFKGVGAKYIQFKPVYDEDRGKNIKPYLEETMKLLNKAKTLEAEEFKIINQIERIENLSTTKRGFEKCRIQSFTSQLGVDGKIYACCLLKYIPKFCLGDLRVNTFKEVWNSQARKKFLKSHNVCDCPPCYYDKTNEILEYLDIEKPINVNFV